MNQNAKFEKLPAFVRVKTRGIELNILVSALYAILIFAIGYIVWYFNNIDNNSLFILSAVLFAIYSITVPIVLGPRHVKQIMERYIKTVEKEVIKEVPKEVNKIVRVPVIRYVERKKKRIESKRYKYVGSNKSKIYHLSTSRLARLIRPKNRVHNNSEAFFLKNKYKPSKHIVKLKQEAIRKAARRASRLRKAKSKQ